MDRWAKNRGLSSEKRVWVDRWAKNRGLSSERWVWMDRGLKNRGLSSESRVWVDRGTGAGKFLLAGKKKGAFCYALFSGAVRRVILPRAWMLCYSAGWRLFLLEERNDPEEEAGAYDCGEDLAEDGGAE